MKSKRSEPATRMSGRTALMVLGPDAGLPMATSMAMEAIYILADGNVVSNVRQARG